jgi:hypothetical protein
MYNDYAFVADWDAFALSASGFVGPK